jgi:hypothetical protein
MDEIELLHDFFLDLGSLSVVQVWFFSSIWFRPLRSFEYFRGDFTLPLDVVSLAKKRVN